MAERPRAALIGCYTPQAGRGAGIAVVHADDGVLSEVDTVAPAVSPSFVIKHPSLPVIYAVSETANGAVVAWALDGDTPATSLGRSETGGADPCHLTVDASGEYLVTVNYTGSSVAVHQLGADGRIVGRTDLVAHQRHGRHPRQDSGHPHMARAIGAEIVVTDLGGDYLTRYHIEGGRLIRDQTIEAPPASGPRHVIQVGDRFLVTAELSSSILVYSSDWALLGQVSVSRSSADNLVSELVTDEEAEFLYVANRGPDTITVFTLGNGLPEYVTEVPTGRNPRHMARADNLLYVANQDSDEVITMRIDPHSGIPVMIGRLATPSPTCVLIQ